MQHNHIYLREMNHVDVFNVKNFSFQHASLWYQWILLNLSVVRFLLHLFVKVVLFFSPLSLTGRKQMEQL